MDSIRVRRRTLRIDVRHLAMGMEVTELDRPWLDSPFLLQGFVVASQEEIDQLRSLCEWVEILVTEGAVLPPRYLPRLRKPSVARISRKRAPRMTAELPEELQTAAPIYQHGLAEARRLYDSVAEGHDPDTGAVRSLIEQCAASIMRNPGPMQLLARLREKDNYTCEHSLNVALLAMGFGRYLGLNVECLQELGTAAMLHDIGKMRTPLAILNKPGRLDPDEAAIMRDHARAGFEILQNSDVPLLAMNVAHSHHEAPDGSGYPQGLTASDICDYTAIVTLADVFDAITAARPYKPARSPLDALKVIHGQRGSKFHEQLAGDFIRHIGLYPLVSLVKLHSGEVGVVARLTDLLHLPVVVLLRDATGGECEPRAVDLRRAAKSVSQARLIHSVLPHGSHAITPEECIAHVEELQTAAI